MENTVTEREQEPKAAALPPEEEDFATLFDESIQKEDVREGEIVRGKVIEVTKDFVTIDIGYKSEGQISVSEFAEHGGKATVKVGDQVDVYLESRENDDGLCVLSKEKADKLQIWEEISAACERDELVDGIIVARVKGGLSVDIGVKAFLPGSQVDLRPVRNLDKLIGQRYKFKVIKFNKKRGNIVLSRRVLLERERAEMKKDTLERLKEGQVVEGVVKNITEYGCFVDLGGIDGLLHITDMSWGRIGHPSEMFQVGENVRVKVLKFNEDTERVSLGLKQIMEDPWTHALDRFPPGTRVEGKVVSLTDYGAFIELEPGIEGLVHISEMSWTKRVKHPSKVVAVGDNVEAMVLDIDPRNKRISLGMKQIEPNPWTLLRDRYPVGSRIAGKVKNITDFGIFVGVEDGIDGLVHISDLSWTLRVKHPADLFQKGDDVEAMVLHIDVENERFSLGIKQLIEDPWDRIPTQYPVGRVLEVRVMRVHEYGAVVELEKGIEGLIHVSEMADERVEDPNTICKENDTLKCEIINVDIIERRINMSMRAAQRSSERAEYQPYLAGGKPTPSLGDLLKQKLELKDDGPEAAPAAEAAEGKTKE